MTMMLSRSLSGPSPLENFCMVVNTMPFASRPENRSLRLPLPLSRWSACTGTCLRNLAQRQNWPKSWSSRSFLSVTTTNVGFSTSCCIRCAKKTMESDFPDPYVCQKTPICPLPPTAEMARAAAFLTPKYWW